jgi:hypothetical protein
MNLGMFKTPSRPYSTSAEPPLKVTDMRTLKQRPRRVLSLKTNYELV